MILPSCYFCFGFWLFAGCRLLFVECWLRLDGVESEYRLRVDRMLMLTFVQDLVLTQVLTQVLTKDDGDYCCGSAWLCCCGRCRDRETERQRRLK